MNKKIEITTEESFVIEQVRDYFGEYNLLAFESRAHDVMDSLVKKLNLQNVSQQRELLIAFLEWKYASSYDLSDEHHIIDEFFKEKAINCG